MSHSDDCQICGTISSGTLRPEDLIPAFADTLDLRLGELADEQHARGRPLSPELFRALSDLEEVKSRVDGGYAEAEDADADLEWLEETLSHYAPPGHWFGAHPGDGADFGFWPLELLGDDGGGDESAPASDETEGAGGDRADVATAPPRRHETAPRFPEFAHTHVELWVDDERTHLALYDDRTRRLIADWWNEDLERAVRDGILDDRDYHRTAYEAARRTR